MRLSYGQNLQNYYQVPTYEELVEPYKICAKEYYTNHKDSKLTQCQNFIAKRYGFEDWQKLTFFMKEINKALLEIELSNAEWGFILDAFNGHMMSYHDNKQSLLQNLIDHDCYMNGSLKWFDEMSKVDDSQGTWEPCKPMEKFHDTIENLSEFKAKAVLIKAHLYWDQPMGENYLKVKKVEAHTRIKDGVEYKIKDHFRVF